METLEKIYKKGYLEKCELKEDADGFYLDLHYAGINGEDKDLYMPNVRLGFDRNTTPVIVERREALDFDFTVQLDYVWKVRGHEYILAPGKGTVVSKTGEKVNFTNSKYVEVWPVNGDHRYTLDEFAKAFNKLAYPVEINTEALKKELEKKDVKKGCLTCKHSTTFAKENPCLLCGPKYGNWEEKD